MGEDEHQELIKRIKEGLKKIKLDLIYGEFLYRIKGYDQPFCIDILVQIGSVVHIFECKKKGKEKKARKQLEFHKYMLQNNSLYFYWKRELLSYSKIKTYYISEEGNFVMNLERGESCVFDPVFVDNPLLFLDK